MSSLILSTSTTRAEHQHMMCGALAPQKQDLNNKSLTPLRNRKDYLLFLLQNELMS